MLKSSHKDWFEFILDLELLERHLATNNLSPDPSGCSLIVQFLYHANLTEQVYKSDLPDPQVELKTKRIKILRVLAIKSASLLDWDLLRFEKEIPIAVMSDLLHIFLRLTMNDNNEPKYHSQLDLENLETQTLFALQILHRWCIRSVIFSKFPKKPPTKPVNVNLPGSLSSLQHMKDANENILKVITQNVQESVEFLEKMFKSYDGKIYKPSPDCFINISSETGAYDLEWSNSYQLESNEIKAFLAHDLGMYYFQADSFEKSFYYFNFVRKYIKNVDETKQMELSQYAQDLKSYLSACKSMLGIELDFEDSLVNTNDAHTREVLSKMIEIENCMRNDQSKLYSILLKDNKHCLLSISYRLNLEKSLKEILKDRKIIDQISSLNKFRLMLENSCLSGIENLESVSQVVEDIFDKFNVNIKNQLIFSLTVNLKHFNKKNQFELQRILKKCYSFENETCYDENEKMDIDDAKIFNSTSSSPTNSSFSLNRYLRENSLLRFAVLSLQTCDPLVLKDCINGYNRISPKLGLRFFWPKWQLFANELNNVVSLANYINNSYKFNNTNDVDYFYICYAKIQQLIYFNRFSDALKLYASYEDSNNLGQKASKFIRNQYIYLMIRFYLFNYDFSYVKEHKIDSVKNICQPNQDEILISCRTFFDSLKNDPDFSSELIKHIFAFLLTNGEFNFIISQENAIQTIQKKNILNINSPITFLYKLVRQISRLCLDINRPEKNLQRKIARDLWDNIIDIFTDLSNIEQNKIQFKIRETLRNFFLIVKNRQVRTIIISVLSTVFNVADPQANIEIHNEFRYLWPSSLATLTTLNLSSLTDLLNILLIDSIYFLNPFEVNWLKTHSDIMSTKNLFNDSIRGLLQVLVCESKHFFKFQKKDSNAKKTIEEFDEKIIKTLIKSCVSLNKHTQAALLCQCLSNTNNYGPAFKYLQESTWTSITTDEMDGMYSCVWDIALLEYLANVNYQRGYLNRKNICLKLISKENLNPLNPNDIYKKTIEIKKTLLFLKLLNYYFF